MEAGGVGTGEQEFRIGAACFDARFKGVAQGDVDEGVGGFQSARSATGGNGF